MTSDYLDFELEIGQGIGREYPLTVLRSPAGEARATMRFPFDELALENNLLKLQNALLRSGAKRRKALSPEQQAVEEFGQALFAALMGGDLQGIYRVSKERAWQDGKGLRVKLRFQDPELATLPWEILYDPQERQYVCRSRETPVVRYIELQRPVRPFAVTPPLRILGMIASPSDMPGLDVAKEKTRIEQATEDLRARGLIELCWLEGDGWRDLQRTIRNHGPWHIFHFIGHGAFDEVADEGMLVFTNEDGRAELLHAGEVGLLLSDHPSLRLAWLSSCEGARGGKLDLFSSTASILVQQGLPAVVAMQYEITDRAAVELSRAFYEALADGYPVDAALAEARVAVSVALPNTVEWCTPVLTMRSANGVLFDVKSSAGQTPSEVPPESRKAAEPMPYGSARKPGQGRTGGLARVPRWSLLVLLALCAILATAGALAWRQTNVRNARATEVAQATALAMAPTAMAEPIAVAKESGEETQTATAVAAMTTSAEATMRADEANRVAAAATAEWLGADDDRDSLSNEREMELRTLPAKRDTDEDALDDGEEVRRGTDPLVADSDGDGIADGSEVSRGLNPLAQDTDGDGINDPLDPDPYRLPTATVVATVAPPTDTPPLVPTAVPATAASAATPIPEPTQVLVISQVVDDLEGASSLLESDFEINRNAGNDGQLSLAGIPHVSEGGQALAFQFDIRNSAPDDYIGFDRQLPPQDWSSYDSLCFWIESDGSNRSLVLQFGESRFKFWKQFYSLSSGTGDYCLSLHGPHQIDLRDIGYYGVYVAGPPMGQSIIYIDNARLQN